MFILDKWVIHSLYIKHELHLTLNQLNLATSNHGLIIRNFTWKKFPHTIRQHSRSLCILSSSGAKVQQQNWEHFNHNTYFCCRLNNRYYEPHGWVFPPPIHKLKEKQMWPMMQANGNSLQLARPKLLFRFFTVFLICSLIKQFVFSWNNCYEWKVLYETAQCHTN